MSEENPGPPRAASRNAGVAIEELAAAAHAELKVLASRQLLRERPNHTLQPTDLVSEAYVKVAQYRPELKGRAHFFALAAKMIRQILVDYAKGKNRLKRGGGWKKITLHDGYAASGVGEIDILALEEALDTVSRVNPHYGEVVVLRFFGGMTIQEVSEVMGIAPRTVDEYWAVARARLKRELDG